jgi:hypothetical protein
MPTAIAFDQSGYLWVVNNADTNANGNIAKYNPSGGSWLSGSSGYSDANGPAEIAIDVSGNAWVANVLGSLSGFNSEGAALPGSPTTWSSDGPAAYGVAVDASSNVWVTLANDGQFASVVHNALNEYTPSSNAWYWTGDAATYSGDNAYMSAGNDIAIDGGGNLWVSDSDDLASMVSEFNSSDVPISPIGYNVPTGSDNPMAIAIDGSGNVWTANFGGGFTSPGVTEYVGVATPVVTPVVANLLPPYSTSTVNKP